MHRLECRDEQDWCRLQFKKDYQVSRTRVLYSVGLLHQLGRAEALGLAKRQHKSFYLFMCHISIRYLTVIYKPQVCNSLLIMGSKSMSRGIFSLACGLELLSSRLVFLRRIFGTTSAGFRSSR